jgi:hypothetical protein
MAMIEDDASESQISKSIDNWKSDSFKKNFQEMRDLKPKRSPI